MPSAQPMSLPTGLILTDGGLETTLVFHDALSLPAFAAFPLLEREAGRERLLRYFLGYGEIAARHGAGFVIESPTWRANADWGQVLGYDAVGLDAVNRAAITLCAEVRDRLAERVAPIWISGNIGPRGDGYQADQQLDPDEAQAYHTAQILTFSQTQVDFVSAMTLTHVGEAIGVTRAAAAHGLPCVIAFTVETDGRLPSGEGLADAIRAVDAATDGYPAWYMINCAHPSHFAARLGEGGDWRLRIGGLRANASCRSHAELDAAEVLDEGDPLALGEDYRALLAHLPSLRILGGCCGTDERHVDAVATACAPYVASAGGAASAEGAGM